jgi:DNA-binding transcriptional ArsR family regulator
LTTAERDLAEAIRAELSAIDPPRRCCRLAERAGLGGAFERRRRTIVRLELRLRRPSAAVVAAAAAAGGGAAVATAGAPADRAAMVVASPSVPDFDWSSAAEHCRTAYLRGLFLAHGSLSLASGRTHLEFVVSADGAETLARRLAELDMRASWRVRRGRGVVTWKSAETVGTFLRLVGGGSALLELEARQVSRSVRGDLNRVINAESANLQRAVAAAARELEAIAALEADGRLAEQPYLVRLVADARRDVPEATFSELAERLGVHRSAVQRALERIERLALHPDEGEGRRRGLLTGRTAHRAD